VQIALRTQQIFAYETGIASTADPLGGSYAVESMTLDIERAARALIEKIDAMGGAMEAIESGFMQHEIGDSAYAAQRALETKSAIVVGINEFIEDDQTTLPILVIDESVERDQVARLQSFREKRTKEWQRALAALDDGARGGANLMPLIVDAVRNDCTIGEIAPSASTGSRAIECCVPRAAWCVLRAGGAAQA
jgi:methylmalonyl-CoA mutase N-terminal domain/subunit